MYRSVILTLFFAARSLACLPSNSPCLKGVESHPYEAGDVFMMLCDDWCIVVWYYIRVVQSYRHVPIVKYPIAINTQFINLKRTKRPKRNQSLNMNFDFRTRSRCPGARRPQLQFRGTMLLAGSELVTGGVRHQGGHKLGRTRNLLSRNCAMWVPIISNYMNDWLKIYCIGFEEKRHIPNPIDTKYVTNDNAQLIVATAVTFCLHKQCNRWIGVLAVCASQPNNRHTILSTFQLYKW